MHSPTSTESLDIDGEEVRVLGFERELPVPSGATGRNKLVRNGLDKPGTALTEDAWYSVARAVVYPETVAAQFRNLPGEGSSLIEEHVQDATLQSVHARVWLTELFPGLQPRTGQESLPVADPVVNGCMTLDGEPFALVSYRYQSLAHLQDHLEQTFAFTRRANKNPYDLSILSRKVTRPVIAHPAVFDFEDGTEPINTLIVRDGITRLTSAWALISEGDTPEEIAATAVRTLLSEKPTRRGGAEKPLNQRMAAGRQDALDGLLGEFRKGVSQSAVSGRAIRLGQTLILPAQITVGVKVYEESMLLAPDAFDEAVRSILASVHVEFKAWDPAAQNVEVGTRALFRAASSSRSIGSYAGVHLGEVRDLATGRQPLSAMARTFNEPAAPATPLWRAVLLTHYLSRPEVLREIKSYAKEIKGTRRMERKGYAELLGPMVDLPWRSAKKGSLNQARNAWANGGVLTDEVLSAGWTPAVCEDFTSLVLPALAGDDDARLTLAVAGGIALITDKMITRNVGSAVGRTVPFRADVHLVVAGLSAVGNEVGLWLLAHAANAFDADREAVNSLTEAQFSRPENAAKPRYPYTDVNLEAADRIRRDEAGAPVLLTQFRIVSVSDPTRTAAFEADREDAVASEDMSVGNRIARDRKRLRVQLDQAREQLNGLMALADSAEAGTLTAFGSRDEWHALHAPAADIQTRIWANQPQEEPEPEETADEEDDQD